MNKLCETIFNNIRSLCDDCGISVNELERECGLAKGTVARWRLNERRSPRIHSVAMIASYFGVSIDELVKEE